MNTKRYQFGRMFLIVLLVGLLFITLASPSEVFSVKAAEPQAVNAAAVPGGPGYVMIPAVAFLPESPANNYAIRWGELYVTSGFGFSFYAPVYLPQGAQLTGLTMYYRNSRPLPVNLGVELLRKLLPGGSSGEPVGLDANAIQTGGPVDGFYQRDTIPDSTRALIDNSQYVYWVSLYIAYAPAYLQLQAVRIDYTYNVNLPLIVH